MYRLANHSHKLQVVNTIALIVFCFAIGEVTALLLTAVIFDVDSDQVFGLLRDSASPADRSLLMVLSFFSTVFRFAIVPGFYLLFTDKRALNFLRTSSKIRFAPAVLIFAIILILVPCTSILAELNYRVEFPVWLSELETYFKESDAKALQLASQVLAFDEPMDLAVVILIMAVIPGIAEEFFFRGIVQVQLQHSLKNPHYSIMLNAALFSFFHFQFYGFIPKMALGVLFGYVFYWSKNIWYPVIMHIANNLIGVLGVYFIGPEIMHPDTVGAIPSLMIIASVGISFCLIIILKRVLTLASISESARKA